MSQNERKPAPIGQEMPKTPADRVRLIQEMQQQAELQHAQAAAPQAQPQQAAPAQQATPMAQVGGTPGLSETFNVAQVNALRRAISAPTSPQEAAAYGRAQASTQALFGGGADIEILGNPWKVIPFGDVLPGLFEGAKATDQAEVPEKAVRTEDGLLFELGLTSAGSEKPTQTRAVLVDAQGLLAGAECKTPEDVTRLFTHVPHLLPQSARDGAKWQVLPGKDSAFAMRIDRTSGRGRTTEALALNNFARPPDAKGRLASLDVAHYFLDRFDAAIR
jgi:hypothetical protein